MNENPSSTHEAIHAADSNRLDVGSIVAFDEPNVKP